MKALIVSNGDLNEIDIMSYFENADIVICADGGARHLYKHNLVPNVIIGDLDSINIDILRAFEALKVEFQKHPVNKDKSDTELAVEFAIQKGALDIVIIGATGTRLDHSMANIMMLYKLINRKINVVIIDNHNEIFITKSEVKLNKKDGYFISIIPLIDSKVTLKGFEYETDCIDFSVGSTLGISNVVTKEVGVIKIEEGICLVIRSRD